MSLNNGVLINVELHQKDSYSGRRPVWERRQIAETFSATSEMFYDFDIYLKESTVMFKNVNG
jgi:hypothetical protein